MKEADSLMTDAEVTECLDRARKGDEKAVLDIFNYMYPHVAKLVQANLPVRESAEDLIQQVCVKVTTHLHQFSGKVPLLHWVSRIAVNTCLNQIRHEKRRPEVRLADLSEDEAAVVEHLAHSPSELSASEQFASRELVDKLLESLKPKDRLLMRLMYLEGRHVDEIASLTGWSRTLIKVRAFRARAEMRKIVAKMARDKYL